APAAASDQQKARDRSVREAKAKSPDLLPPCTTGSVRIRSILGKAGGIPSESGNGEQIEVPRRAASTSQDSSPHSSPSGCCFGSTIEDGWARERLTPAPLPYIVPSGRLARQAPVNHSKLAGATKCELPE